MAVAKEIQVLPFPLPSLYPAVFRQYHAPAVINNGIPESRKYAAFQFCLPVHLIQRSGRSLQIMDIFRIMPDAVIGAQVSQYLNT